MALRGDGGGRRRGDADDMPGWAAGEAPTADTGADAVPTAVRGG